MAVVVHVGIITQKFPAEKKTEIVPTGFSKSPRAQACTQTPRVGLKFDCCIEADFAWRRCVERVDAAQKNFSDAEPAAFLTPYSCRFSEVR